ncbi:MAG TPA: hypothetical protein VI451_12805, partial [Anaerolineales bacterium]|nr:hypothetical protein [Anaerolineales bacterium]
ARWGAGGEGHTCIVSGRKRVRSFFCFFPILVWEGYGTWMELTSGGLHRATLIGIRLKLETANCGLI